MESNPHKEMAVAGSGAIAIGLAALASTGSERVRVLARSEASAEKARAKLEKTCSRIDGADTDRIEVTTDLADLAGVSFAVEAIVEDMEAKAVLLGQLAEAAPEADLATTTSSLSVGDLASNCSQPGRLFGLHVFNPVPVMKLVELCLPDTLDPAIGERAAAWCTSVGKTPIVVPDTAGFVVNRLLFPYLFDAARFQEQAGMSSADVDTCMSLGLAHPMGPLALLDLVGLDVAVAIGEALNAESGNPDHLAPESVQALVAEGNLGRKTGRGFHDYS